MKLRMREAKLLDFDLENRPLSYWYDGRCTAEITAIAASFALDAPMHVWLLGADKPWDMLTGFVRLYDAADIVTGHYIRKHDLPIINGALLEYGMLPLKPKLTVDTKLDLRTMKDISASQESLAEMLGCDAPKIGMSQGMWRAANRLQQIELTNRRVTGDVRQHQEMRLKLVKLGMLESPKMWSPEV